MLALRPFFFYASSLVPSDSRAKQPAALYLRVVNFLQCSQQECHIQRERQNLAHASDIIISQLDCAAYMVLFRMVQKAINFFKGLYL